MATTMTPRERWLAALRMQPVDRLPFWPKLDAAYAPSQRGPFAAMATMELHRWIGADPHVGTMLCVRDQHEDNVGRTYRTEGRQRHVTYTTPLGDLHGTDVYDPASASWHPRVYPVQTLEDVDRLHRYYEGVTPVWDKDLARQERDAIAALGEDGLAFAGLPPSPLMDWLQHLAGIENGLLLLWDHRQRVEALFEAMHRVQCARFALAAERSAHVVLYSTENTSTTILSPALFRAYCLPHLQAYGRILADADKLYVLHMCGKLKRLLPDLNAIAAAGNEAFTTAPVGDTSLLDGRNAMPQRCLIGGTNATDWLQPAETIIAALERELAPLPHRRGIVLTSAGVMPPACPPETIREVASWVHAQAV